MDSAFHPHFKTNYVPSTEDIGVINSIVENTDQAVNDFDMEIDKLQQQLHAVQEKRSKLKDSAEQHRVLMTPARRISRDVLEEIFLACLPTDHNPCMSATEPPLLLTHICSSWREIAHSTPRLWASIHIVLPPFPESTIGNEKRVKSQMELLSRRLQREEEMIKEWFNRAHTRPLSISIYQSDSPLLHITLHTEIVTEVEGNYSEFLARTVIPHAARWYEMDVFVTKTVFRALLRSKSESPATEHTPLLQKLHVSIHNQPMNSQNRLNCQEVFNIVPSGQLSSLTLQGFKLQATDIPTELWHNITELSLQVYNSATSCVKLLHTVVSYCSSVEKLELRISHSRSDDQWTSKPPVQLLHLKSLILAISHTPAIEIIHFAEKLYFPSLEALDFQYESSSADMDMDFPLGPDIEVLNTLLRDCGGQIQSLNFHNSSDFQFQGKDIVHVLELFPNLKNLKLSPVIRGDRGPSRWNTMTGTTPSSAYIINDYLLESLTPHEDDYSNMLCPFLESLECSPFILAELSPEVIRSFITGRMKAHQSDKRIASLKRFCVYINDLRPKDNPNQEKVSLGEKSAVYYERPDEFSPWEGLNSWRDKHSKYIVDVDMCKEV